jgi:hypothetical protein
MGSKEELLAGIKELSSKHNLNATEEKRLNNYKFLSKNFNRIEREHYPAAAAAAEKEKTQHGRKENRR